MGLLVEGNSGVVGYCEIVPLDHMKPGYIVKEGELLGYVTPVLKEDRGNGTTMVHFELYETGTRNHVTWLLDKEKPSELLNPRDLLTKIKENHEQD